jgi:capsular polysaccharide biosynthesis protein
MENQSFNNQIKICANAEIIIGPYGAGLINCIWQKKGSKVLEIRPNNDNNANCFFAAADAIGLKYYYVLSNKENLIKSTKTSDYFLNLENLKKCLIKIEKNDYN